jgi:hypothetical protein
MSSKARPRSTSGLDHATSAASKPGASTAVRLRGSETVWGPAPPREMTPRGTGGTSCVSGSGGGGVVSLSSVRADASRRAVPLPLLTVISSTAQASLGSRAAGSAQEPCCWLPREGCGQGGGAVAVPVSQQPACMLFFKLQQALSHPVPCLPGSTQMLVSTRRFSRQHALPTLVHTSSPSQRLHHQHHPPW